MAYQWRYFVELHGKRSSNGFGVNPISYQDMYAYFKLIRYTPEEWEIDLINQLDSVFLEVYNKQQESQQKSQQKKK